MSHSTVPWHPQSQINIPGWSIQGGPTVLSPGASLTNSFLRALRGIAEMLHNVAIFWPSGSWWQQLLLIVHRACCNCRRRHHMIATRSLTIGKVFATCQVANSSSGGTFKGRRGQSRCPCARAQQGCLGTISFLAEPEAVGETACDPSCARSLTASGPCQHAAAHVERCMDACDHLAFSFQLAPGPVAG